MGEEAADRKRRDHEDEIYRLQVELVKLQRNLIERGQRLLILLEGRDAAGKDGLIKTFTEHLSPRETRVVALGKPSDREQMSWYFQRYIAHLPAAHEMVLFNRSWYNRAGVERVMNFCTDDEYEEFMETVVGFEEMLVRSGIRLFKYYLDITRTEQEKRLADRRRDPLKQWKISPVDEQSVKKWNAYSEARNAMFARTHHAAAPWTVVCADHKHRARVNMIKDFLARVHYKGKDETLLLADPDVVFLYQTAALEQGKIAP